MALRVNGELVSDERFYREFLSLTGGLTPQQVEQRSVADFRQAQQLTERNVLRAVLLRQFALAEGLTVTDAEIEEERRALWRSTANQSCGTGITEEMTERAAIRRAERHLTRHVPRPSRQEVQRIYQDNPSMFHQPERWLVSQIVRLAEGEEERQAAREALAPALDELRRGKPFAVTAERYSDCKGGGGTLGWLMRGDTVPEFEENVFLLNRRRVSDIFETTFGLHIAIVQDYKPAGLQPLDEIRLELARRIFDDRRQSVLDQALEEIFRGATVQVVNEPMRSVADGEKVR
jgi:hypothetical protein